MPEDPMPRPIPSTSLKLRVLCGSVYAMGPGKADLLDAVGLCRSIAGAGRSLGYSYWKTRHLIDEMNACFLEPVVTTVKGGQGRGGAVVTATGLQALALFRAMEAKAVLAIQADLKDLGALLAAGT
jgi:molybdate transport system regulatory protein